ncbi:hypothetical protein GYMLUDRAFT_821052 [Collybiopsis luxurians FD-317 M1]|uniref:C2H2-type domain-containing protein n=1 Tax=Collybiopsis luxurians FD-317 M1 TaxID=944289 RepID=A0A0D0B090_9AGAR|nr:hypothetical protein GYMLUDRAFT_821052 [Collybiopsis luxurians FD-317 M1]
MPKTQASKTESLRDPTVCELCGTKVARKGDIPRHMQSHLSAEEKASMYVTAFSLPRLSRFLYPVGCRYRSYSCPYEDCTYKSLQKVNVDTHIRKHTKVKDLQCPACDFATGDPGSLTRHRKRRHEYVPKQRKPRTPGNGPREATPAQTLGEMIIETPADYASQGSSQLVEAPPSEASSPSQSALALDAGYEPLLFVDESDSYVPSRPSGRRLGLADILSDDVYWH